MNRSSVAPPVLACLIAAVLAAGCTTSLMSDRAHLGELYGKQVK